MLIKESVKVKGYLIELQPVFSFIIFQIIDAFKTDFCAETSEEITLC